MLANVLAHWLTSAGERSYEGPFCQLLISEGYTVLFAPVHHPFEHGKDLVAFAPDGALCAYQLKGGDIGLSALEGIMPQLLALCATAITYPGVEPPRKPNRAYLVTNGNLSTPARDRLSTFNTAQREDGRPIVEVIEKEHLLSRFGRLHDTLLPTQAEDFNELLNLALADGRSEFQVAKHCKLLDRLFRQTICSTTPAGNRRGFASSLLLTAYALTPWLRRDNHLAVAQGWFSLCFLILAEATAKDLPAEQWEPTLIVARDMARGALGDLLNEASSAEDLVIPDMVDGLVYPARSLAVLGYCAAFWLAENDHERSPKLAQSLVPLLLRELEFARATGECSAGQIFVICIALEDLKHFDHAGLLAAKWMVDLAKLNQPGSEEAIADPYHGTEEVLLWQFDDAELGGERFDGHAYSLHVFIDWCARRGWRSLLEKLWPQVTRILFAEHRPADSAGLLRHHDETGQHYSWAAKYPQSFAELAEQSRQLEEEAIPTLLWQQPYLLPFLPLLYPHRLTSAVGKAIDWMVLGRCEIRFKDEESTSTSIPAQ